MNPVFDKRMFEHVNQTLVKERGRTSKAVEILEGVFGFGPAVFAVCIAEKILTVLLCLPIPIYSSAVYHLITSARGLPKYGGMYARALHYRGKLGSMASNVFIDQGVFFAYPKSVGPHPDLMPLELRGIRAISGLHSSDRVQRIPWGSACPGRCVDALHCNRSATKSRFPRRLRAIRRRARSGTPRAAAH